MTNYLTLAYLSSLIPPLVGAMSRYPLRNSEQYQTIDAKSQLYYNSFHPSTIREWNTPGNTVQSCPSVTSFKKKMSTRQPVPNYYYLTGSINEQIHHARIRTNCSSLHYTLFSKTSYKTSSVHVAKLKTSSIFSSLVQGSLPSVKLC